MRAAEKPSGVLRVHNEAVKNFVTNKLKHYESAFQTNILLGHLKGIFHERKKETWIPSKVWESLSFVWNKEVWTILMKKKQNIWRNVCIFDLSYSLSKWDLILR